MRTHDFPYHRNSQFWLAAVFLTSIATIALLFRTLLSLLVHDEFRAAFGHHFGLAGVVVGLAVTVSAFNILSTRFESRTASRLAGHRGR